MLESLIISHDLSQQMEYVNLKLKNTLNSKRADQDLTLEQEAEEG